MALIPNLVRSGDSGSSGRTDGTTGLEGLADRMAEIQRKKKKKDEEDRLAQQSADAKKKSDDDARVKAEEEKKKSSLGSRLARGLSDIWQADSEADQKRRTDAGQPALYKDQQAQKKKTADEFQGKTSEEFDRADSGIGNLSSDELEKRRLHYKANGFDVDQVLKDKAEYDALQKRRAGGESLVKLTKEGAITEGAKRFEKQQKDLKKAEDSYQRDQKAAAGAENAGAQAERGFVRGAGSPIAEAPSSAEAVLGAALKAVAPEGSRIQKAGERISDQAKKDKTMVDAKIKASGYAAQEADDPLIRGVSEGAGSLAASMVAARAGGTISAAGLFGLNQGADQAIAAEEAGKSDVQSFITGAASGVLEGILEKVGLDKFLGAGGSTVKRVTTRMVTEGTQEASQSLAQSGVQATYSHVDLQQAIQQALTEGGLGAVVGGGAGLPMSIAENLQSKGVDQDTALQTGFNVQDRLEAIINEERSPKAGQDPNAPQTAPELAAPAANDRSGTNSLEMPAERPARPEKPKYTVDWKAYRGMDHDELEDADFGSEATGFGETADTYQVDGKPAVALRWSDRGNLEGFSVAREFRGTGLSDQVIRELAQDEGGVLKVDGPNPAMMALLRRVGDVEGNPAQDDSVTLRLRPETAAAGTAQDAPATITSPAQAGSVQLTNGPAEQAGASDGSAAVSSPKPKSDFTGQAEVDSEVAKKTDSQNTNKLDSNETVSLLNQQQQVITKKLIVARRNNDTEAMAAAVDELESVGMQLERATMAGNGQAQRSDGSAGDQRPTAKRDRGRSDAVKGPAGSSTGDGAAADADIRQADQSSGQREAAGAAGTSGVASSAAADGGTGTGGRPGAGSRAPVAGGATIVSDETAKDQGPSNRAPAARSTGAGNVARQAAKNEGSAGASAGRVSSVRPRAAEETDAAVERPAGKAESSQAAGRQRSDNDSGRASRQRSLDALTDYKEFSEGRKSERPVADMIKLVEQLNKAGQAGAILRRGDLKSKKAGGMFTRKGGDGKDPKTAKDPRIMLQDAVIKDPEQYATVLAHELSHAMEFYVTGSTAKTLSMFDLTDEEKTTVTNELKRVVDELEGADVAQAKPGYYYSPTEMLARYVEMRLLFPGKAETMAPVLTEHYDELVMREPMIQDLMAALDGNIDKGAVNFTPNFLKDVRQTYRRRLGKHVGDIAYNAEVRRRAEINRSQVLIAKLIKRKFKGVKDDAADLFRAAEAVLITKDGEPQFGTHDFLWDVSERDLEKSLKAGYSVVEKKPVLTDKQIRAIQAGEEVADDKIKFEYDLAKVRYTPKQAEQIFNQLTPAGQQLIKDFTAAKEEAKDEFNRELMKDLYHIDSKVEGWVHHYFEGKPMGGNAKATLRQKTAAAKKLRKNADGYVEDFRKAIEKALTELDRNEINNGFIRDQLARISKPIAKGEKPEKGWVEVVADEKGGLRLPGEGMQVMIKPDEGKAVKVPQKRYQVPEDLARHYREIRDVPAEVNMAARALNRIAKYWTLNVLIHPGTASTNFISGGLQYGAKIMNDFYLDLLTANFGMSRTRHNLIAPLQALTPGGWTNAPDWLYGGFRAGTMAGGMTNYAYNTKIDRGLDVYGDKMLYAMGLIETYWKKTIALSEGSALQGASRRRITERLQADELKMVDALNEAIDFYAFDYDNKPLWMSRVDRSGLKIVKPFMTYPYKYTKFITSFAAAGFDRSLPWQTRVSKVLTLTTIMAFIAMMYDDREEEKKTPDGSEDTPLTLSPNGRVYIGTAEDGKEVFVRTTKYPFFNVTSLGKSMMERNGKESLGLLNEMFATVGPGFELFMLATGRGDQFSQYTPASARIGELLGGFIPGFRVFNDIGKLFDEKERKPENFVQGIGSQLPIWGSEETRARWRGDVRTIKIPDEPEGGRELKKTTRTITERERTVNRSDVLTSLLTGVYFRRIDPAEARKQELREQRDAAETTIREQLGAGNEADAETLAKEHGFTISNDTLKYYRTKRKKAGN